MTTNYHLETDELFNPWRYISAKTNHVTLQEKILFVSQMLLNVPKGNVGVLCTHYHEDRQWETQQSEVSSVWYGEGSRALVTMMVSLPVRAMASVCRFLYRLVQSCTMYTTCYITQ